MVRRMAVMSIPGLGSDRADALPAATAALGDPDWRVRAGAVRAIGTMDPTGKLAAARVEKMLLDPDRGVRSEAGIYFALRNLDRVPPLRKGLADRDEKVRVRAASELTLWSHSDAVTKALIRKSLDSKDREIRTEAAATIAREIFTDRDEMKPLFPILVDGLKSEIHGVSHQAAFYVMRDCYRDRAAEAVANLIPLLTDDSPVGNHESVRADDLLKWFAATGMTERIPVSTLAELLNRDRGFVVSLAVVKLLRPRGSEGHKALIAKYRKSRSVMVRSAIFGSLAAAGNVEASQPMWVELFADKEVENRKMAISQVADVKLAEQKRKMILQGLDDPEASVRWMAAEAIFSMKYDRAQHEPILAEVSRRAKTELDPLVLEALFRSLSACTSRSKEAVAFLSSQLKSESAEIRHAAILGLLEQNAAAVSAIPAIEALKSDPDSSVRFQAERVSKDLTQIKEKNR
jgi:HEAT repeat protein